MEGALSELGQQLLRCADPALLDARLDALSARVADEEARGLLIAAFEEGQATTLRDLLSGATLARWVSETCTPREEQALYAQLRRWLGLGQRSSDDPVRLLRVDEPPDDAAGVRAWAARYGVEGELARPACEVLVQGPRLDPTLTLLACCVGEGEGRLRGESLLTGHSVREEARAYLRGEAALQASRAARKALWARGLPQGSLRHLAQRLWAVLVGPAGTSVDVGAAVDAVHVVNFVPAVPVQVDTDTGVAQGALRAEPEKPPIGATLYLSGYEERGVSAACSRCSKPACLHVRALAARLFDACLDEDDRLHTTLEEFVRVPSWQRFMRAVTAPERADAEHAARVCFVIRCVDGRASVGALVQKPGPNGRFSPGKAVPAARLLRAPECRERDRPVLEAMSYLGRSFASPFVPADMLLWRALAEHPHVRLEGRDEPVRVLEQSLEVSFVEQPEGLLPQVALGGEVLAPGAVARDADHVFRYDAAACTWLVAPLTPALRRLLSALEHFRGVLPPESHASLAPWLASLGKVARVRVPEPLLGKERPPERKLLLRIEPGLDEGITLSLTFRALPLGALWPPGQGPALVHGLVDGVAVYARRDLDWERAQAERVLEALQVASHLRLDAFTYRVETNQDALALLSRAAQLSDVLDIAWAERARALQIHDTVRRGDLKIHLFKRGAWLEVSGGARVAGVDLAVGRLLEAARRGERYVLIEGQTYAEIEQTLFERLRAAQLCVSGGVRAPALSVAAAPYFRDTLGEDVLSVENPALLAGAAQASAQVTLREDLHEKLLPYQREGARWLIALSSWAPGACLADEMGLGKTVQAIALLAHRAASGAALVVTPTSLVDNWLGELARFAPELRAHAYRGAKRRACLASLGPGVVLVASYETLLRDRAHFMGVRFATQVVDEAQVIKNARTQRARVVAEVQADFRVALSGTPVENRLGDLWSLFHLLAPELLGSWARFRARFAVPIERYDNSERAAALRALIAPLVLRRTKDQVAKELPARTEVVHMVALSPAEQELYDAAARYARKALGKRSRDEAARHIQLLAELTRLRQLACHPRLVLHDARVESSKLHAFLRLLEDVLPRGHHVLVFSQFTRHLALVREALDARGIASLYLDGATPGAERARLVARFQAGEAQVFLISLKAGGTGLNLTRADYVVHLDPWWNPAAEDQASDRAHRLGQSQPVTVVKLVAQGTLEERVISLHRHKRRLSQAVLGEELTPDTLTRAELEALLQA